MRSAVVIVPHVEGAAGEVARLIDSAAPLASVLEPVATLEPGGFRDAVVGAALERGSVAGVLFAARWGGGAGKILKKIQAWLSIRRQGVRRL